MSYPIGLHLNDRIRLPDGRVGTICWNNLDGCGGVWGEHHFEMPSGGFGDELPAPEFMLREKEIEQSLRQHHAPDMECVGTEFERVKEKP